MNAWGESWGVSWGSSWDFGSGPTPPVTEAPLFYPSGGIVPFEQRDPYGLPREVFKVIEQVAKRQVEDLRQDETQRTEELYRELELRDILLEEKYLIALAETRERLIEQEIGTLLRKKLDDDEAMLLILMAAHLT